MIVGFETTDLGREEIKAGIHQSDFTCRPQIVEEKTNPEYYDLLKKFEIETGISGVLNTSFNIHGYPIVNGPEEALWTMENSDLDALIVPVKLIVEGELSKNQGKPYVIKGITPCSMDLFRYRVYLKNPKLGEALTFLNAGAYNFTTDFCDLEKLETEMID